jgi:hypothetical protein
MISKRPPLYTFVELNDNTPIQKLSILDQMRVLIRNIFKNDADELKSRDALTKRKSELKASLADFIHKATAPVREGKHKSVTVSLASVFEPVLETTFDEHNLRKFYNITIYKPRVEFAKDYMLILQFEVL